MPAHTLLSKSEPSTGQSNAEPRKGESFKSTKDIPCYSTFFLKHIHANFYANLNDWEKALRGNFL